MKKYQTAYLKAQTQEAKAKVMNRAQLNLIASDFDNFVKWQVEQMNADEPQHGGKRSNSGRKPVEDKKVTVAIYPQKSRVEALGAERVKEIAIDAIEKAYKKKPH